MATELAKAYVQIVPSAEGIKGSITNVLDGEADNAGKSAGKKIGSGLTTAISSAAKIGAAAIGTATAGVVALTKQAVGSYADYEQLVGGVETLFKDSAGKVQEYANNAYKTAGISANDYMESVTSFSASLLSSLGGDTDKAAEAANTALIDMSDNANKMGTSLESIQTAYQGFAKQNYTMLDNLKLGYGGTKTEMERLLADAEKLSGVKYDLNNLADVYDAIHVVQTELGITGTTAKEASTTISGSLGMVKTSWANLITGIADDNADFDQLINNFVESVGTASDNIIPRIEVALKGIGDLIGKLAPIIIEKIPELINTILPSLLDSVGTIITSLSNVLPEAISTIVKTIIDNLPMLINAGIQLLGSLVTGIIQALPDLIPAAVDAVITIVETLVDNIDLLIDGAIALIIGLAEGLINALPKLIEKIPEIVIKMVDALIRNAPKLLEAAIQLMVSLANGIINAIPKALSAIGQLVQQLLDRIKGFWQNFKSIGGDLISGLWEGIKSVWNNLVDNVKNLASNLIGSVKGIFGIHSPSKVFANIGEMCVAGFDNAFDDFGEGAVDNVNNAMKELSSVDMATPQLTSNMAINTAQMRNSQTANASNDVYGLLSQYLPNMGGNTNVNVALQGDASNLFRVVRNEVNKFTKATGNSPFVIA